MNNDSISRKDVINEIFDMANDVRKWEQVANDNMSSARIGACKSTLIEMRTRIAKLPTTQTVKPEPLTDMEQRIFLAAMSREEKVCKKVDDDWFGSNEPATISLFKVCREIKRKVKTFLWTPEAIVAFRELPKPYDGPKNERNFSGSKMPYEDISIYIEDRINGILDDYVVKLRLDGKTYTELLTYNGEYFEWLNDWYEGEQEIELLDFFPLEEAVRKE